MNMVGKDMFFDIKSRGVELFLSDEGKLNFKAPKEKFTDDVKKMIMKYKKDIVEYLAGKDTPETIQEEKPKEVEIKEEVAVTDAPKIQERTISLEEIEEVGKQFYLCMLDLKDQYQKAIDEGKTDEKYDELLEITNRVLFPKHEDGGGWKQKYYDKYVKGGS